ncbi:hypothetical protein BH10PLA2_BH10PLA2_18880 [soil metagenome]
MLAGGFVSQAAGDDYRILGKHAESVFALRFNADGSELYSGSRATKENEQKGKVWEIPGGKQKRTFHGARGMYLSPDSQLVAVVDVEKASARILETTTGALRANLAGLPANFLKLVFSRDNKTVAISGEPAESKTVVIGLWDIASTKKLREFGSWESPVYGLAFSADGKYLTSGSWDGSVQIWNTATGSKVAQLSSKEQREGGLINAVAYSPDDRFIAVCGDGVVVWEATKHKLLRKLPFNGYGPALSLAFSGDGRYVAAGGAYQGLAYWLRGWRIVVWDLESWKISLEPKGPIGPADTVYRLVFSPDSSRLAFGTFNGLVGLVETPKSK